MNPRLRKKLVTDVAWLAAAAVFCVAVVGTALGVLESTKDEIHGLRASLAAKEQRLTTKTVAGEQVAALAALRDRLAASRRTIASDAERVSHLSRAARDAGVQLVRLRSGATRLSEDGSVVAKTHRVSVVGGYRELAGFLDGVHASTGIVGIDQLEIAPELEEANGVSTGQLRASLEIAWFGQGTDGGEG